MSFYYAKNNLYNVSHKIWVGGVDRTTATPAPRTDLLNPVDYG